MAKKSKQEHVISWKRLSDKSKVPYHKVYAFLKGTYSTLTHNEKSALMNAFYDETKEVFAQMGFRIEISRIKNPTQTQEE